MTPAHVFWEQETEDVTDISANDDDGQPVDGQQLPYLQKALIAAMKIVSLKAAYRADFRKLKCELFVGYWQSIVSL